MNRKQLEKRKHSKFSASASERWLNCSASVEACERVPPLPDTEASVYGTEAHSQLEKWLLNFVKTGRMSLVPRTLLDDYDMYEALKLAMLKINSKWNRKTETLETEKRFYLDHIHPEMFGTGDVTIYKAGGILKVYDYKHGVGHVVEVIKENKNTGIWELNPQLMFYLIGAAKDLNDDFKDAEIGVIQPRAPHRKGPFRTIKVTKKDIQDYTTFFKKGVDRVMSKPKYFLGPWCYFCAAKNICPLQEKLRVEKASDMFDDEF